MATIFYSLAGEGRGHATRVRTIVEHLRKEHRFVIFAPGDAYDMLAPLYAGSDVRVVAIPGLRFAYARGGAVSPLGTGLAALRYVANLPQLVERLMGEFERERPALAVTDFEPSLPRAAARCGVPFVSLDHQHFLVTSDFSDLPLGLQLRAAAMGRVVDSYYRGQAATIVSSFCFPALRALRGRTLQIGTLLRPSVLAARPHAGKHLVLYLRKFHCEGLIAALAASGLDVRAYGLGLQPRRGNVRFFEIDERRFVEDLAGANALVTTAGNQLLGEALYLRKPVLALPEPQNAEQLLHGHLLAREGSGEWVAFERAGARELRGFLSRIEQYRERIVAGRLNGNPVAIEELRRHLPSAAAPQRALLEVAG